MVNLWWLTSRSGAAGVCEYNLPTTLATILLPTPLCAATDTWDKLVLALADLGQEKLREGLIKDEAGNDVALSPQTEQELVDYEGMLVSGAVAQRRG
jgi:hypothetical protein